MTPQERAQQQLKNDGIDSVIIKDTLLVQVWTDDMSDSIYLPIDITKIYQS